MGPLATGNIPISLEVGEDNVGAVDYAIQVHPCIC